MTDAHENSTLVENELSLKATLMKYGIRPASKVKVALEFLKMGWQYPTGAIQILLQKLLLTLLIIVITTSVFTVIVTFVWALFQPHVPRWLVLAAIASVGIAWLLYNSPFEIAFRIDYESWLPRSIAASRDEGLPIHTLDLITRLKPLTDQNICVLQVKRWSNQAVKSRFLVALHCSNNEEYILDTWSIES